MPENYIHGVPELYATAMPTRGSAIPLVARSNDHLHKVVTKILEVQGITRTTTVIALSQQIGYRVIPLVEAEP